MKDEQEKRLTLREMLGSVLAAALGVQSGKNRARDFSHGKPSHFIILGVGFTVLFVLMILGLVKLVLYLVS
ncbi:DUF2970 domain-containing protein [Pseudomonas songnenensis]|jgi:hypothetical protein|uniref:DUF2970 domain-containing protein n=1 Tax=Pseudomonas songnenensis TaxID=1176259 RepID=A0ABX9UPB0_9PSED|nr:DUF2970 domain-containing protein [Pseudomonas songnenensis]MCQ4299306.1 DUF2970 domain-containing protein [Pseudomonas songnenensis]RMH94647.1 DUF2970 domain-containing protein [Pseudomonas songnenensis]